MKGRAALVAVAATVAAGLSVFVCAQSTDWEREARELFVRELMTHNMPISFFGRVVDQDGMPVAGAVVTIGRMYAEPVHLRSGVVHKVETDAEGRFELSGLEGESLDLRGVEKPGYAFEMGGRGFHYWSYSESERFKPDPSNPVTLVLRKRNPLEVVIPGPVGKSKKLGSVPWSVDLTEGEQRSLGLKPEGRSDVLLSASKEPSGYAVEVAVEDPEGGVVEHPERLYWAPESGYQPRVVLEVPVRRPLDPWPVDRYLYVKARGGTLHACLELVFAATEESIIVRVESWANPNSSRNLEYDEAFYSEYRMSVKEAGMKEEAERRRAKRRSTSGTVPPSQ